MKWRRATSLIGWSLISLAAQAQEKIPPLHPPHGEIPPSLWELYGWKIIFANLGALLLLALIVAWACRPKVVIPEAPAVTARRELESLRGRPEDGALAAAVSRILRRYVMAVLEFPPGELTTTELRQALQTHPKLIAEVAANLGDFLRRCDEWKFAPAPPAPQLNAVQTALEWVGKIESQRNQMPMEAVA